MTLSAICLYIWSRFCENADYKKQEDVVIYYFGRRIGTGVKQTDEI